MQFSDRTPHANWLAMINDSGLAVDVSKSELAPLFSCVAENTETYFRRIEGLAMSLRAFGGKASIAPFVANFIGRVDDRYADRLHELRVDVRVVDRFDQGSVHANKLRMLELADQLDFDVLVALDCDLVVVGDVSDWLSAHRFAAKPADYDYASTSEWDLLFRRLQLDAPARTTVATSTGRPTVPYFNSGVMLIPRWLCGQLLEVWADTLVEIYRHAEEEPSVLPFPFVADQVALACTLLRLKTPYQTLPVGLNFPTHTKVHKAVLGSAADIRVLHYHENADAAGFLYRAQCRLADEDIEKYNRYRAATLDLPYTGLRSPPWRKVIRRKLDRGKLRMTLSGQRASRRARRFR